MTTGIGIKFDDSIRTVGVVKEEENLVAEAIHRILNTSPGERVYQPSFGCRIQELLFEPDDFTSLALGSFFISEAISAYEPRVEVLRITPSILGESNGAKQLSIEIIFRYINDPKTMLRTVTTVGNNG
jgi:phage baseplate assembly protein W